MIRRWQKLLEGIQCLPDEEVIESIHDHVEDYEIVELPQKGEDMYINHGGDDICQDVQDAPEREEAQADSSQDEDIENAPECENAQGDEDVEESEEIEDAEEEGFGSDEDEDVEEIEDEEEGFGFDEDEDVEDADEHAKQHNSGKAFDLSAARRRRLSVSFAAIVGKIAEDLAGWPVEGDDEWDIAAIMERRINHRPLNQCRQSREKEGLVIILDTSGSCESQAEFFSAIASIALKQRDVELYEAPNGCIKSRNMGNGRQPVEDNGAPFNWNFANRTIIFFGDFDGGDAPVIASWKNKVYWFSCEGDRYTDMDEHDWCSYTLADFRGKYYDCSSEEDFIRLVKKVK